MRGGMYWSGDLGYADSRGFCWFAGRAGQWLRVDGENLGTAPVERALLGPHLAIAEAVVYSVPDPVAGDQVMACIVLRGGAALMPAEFGAFLAGQGDLGRKQHPRFIRVASPAAAHRHVQGADPRARRRPVEHERPGVVVPGRTRPLPRVRPARRRAGGRA